MKLFNLHTLAMNKLCLAGLAVAALVSSCGDDLTTQSDSPKEVSTEVSTIAEANNALLSKDNVTITGEITGTKGNTITIPAAAGSTSKTTKTVRMEKIAKGAVVEVQEATGTNESTANDIVVSMPNPASSDNAAKLRITTPSSTVTIKGNAGFTTLKHVHLFTAKHTIVTDGVTLGELEISNDNVGYVRINKEATVNRIEAGASTIVYYEKGATLPPKGKDYGDAKRSEIEVGAPIPQ